MDLTALLAFNLALLAAWLSPGPAMLLAIRASLQGGARYGALTGLGLALAATGWTLAALFGLDIVFRLFPWSFGLLKILGALYLLWIAYQTWRDASAPVSAPMKDPSRAIRSGILVNLANPKSVLFAGAVLVVIFPPDLSPEMRLLVGLNHFVFETLAYGLLSLAVARSGLSGLLLRAKAPLDRAMAALLGALGLRLLFDRST
ncbi:MAG: LysE family transporter [Pseudomonadota bacterium]